MSLTRAQLDTMITNGEDITNADISQITDFSNLFTGWDIVGDISGWDVSHVTNMSWMFAHTTQNPDISNWNTSNVTNMSHMFEDAVFNRDISTKVVNIGQLDEYIAWDVSNVTDMAQMFYTAISFNQNIGNWDVSNVTDMEWMFYFVTSFNQNIGNWDVSSVTNMGGMFCDASSFNQYIGNWDVTNVTDMVCMFASYDTQSSFNQDINTKVVNEGTPEQYIAWDVSNVTNMRDMFNGAISFSQPIAFSWTPTSLASADDMFLNADAYLAAGYSIDPFTWPLDSPVIDPPDPEEPTNPEQPRTLRSSNNKKLSMYFSNNTKRVLRSVFPSEFKLTFVKNNNAFRMVNTLFGIELDLIYDKMDEALKNNSIDTFDMSHLFNAYHVFLNNNIEDTVYGTSGIDVVPIKVTSYSEFYDGTPTRIVNIGSISLDGISSGFAGLEYFRSDILGEGYFVLHTNVLSSQVDETTHQMYKLNIDNDVITLSELSSDPGVLNNSYDATGIDEVIIPPTSSYLKSEYPDLMEISAPEHGIEGRSDKKYYIKHFTPFNGYTWDPVNLTYIAIGYNSDSYIGGDGEKIYYETAKNNPFGYMNYSDVFMNLKYTPINETLRLYDIDNLDSEGNATEIPKEGIQLYKYRDYIGYSPVIPSSYIEDEPEAVATPYPSLGELTSSWDYCYVGDGLNGDLIWISNVSAIITNKIKIHNPHSRYIVTYKYVLDKNIEHITSTNSDRNTRIADEDYMYIKNSEGNNRTEIPFKMSKDPDPNKIAITFDGMSIRPGSTIDELQLETISSTGGTMFSSNITIPTNKRVVGFSTDVVPNRVETKIYYLNLNFDNDLIGDFVTEAGAEVRPIVYNTYIGTRINNNGGTSYYPHSYVSMEPSIPNIMNRFFRCQFSLNSYVSPNGVNLIQSADGLGKHFLVKVLNDGKILVSDEEVYITSSNTIDLKRNKYEVVIERDYDYERDINHSKYNIYIKVNDGLLKRLNVMQNERILNTIYDSSSNLFVNSSLDVRSAHIYDEPMEYIR